ncbi:hypothetical protein Tco_1253960 [Tanacetum coccineum]
MVEYSQKYNNGTSRKRSTETSDGLTAIQAQLNNLGREIKKVNEKLYTVIEGDIEQRLRDSTRGTMQTLRIKNEGQYIEDTLSKFMSELAKRHKENSNMIKEIQASTNAVIRNQGALIKTLEIQIGQMSKIGTVNIQRELLNNIASSSGKYGWLPRSRHRRYYSWEPFCKASCVKARRFLHTTYSSLWIRRIGLLYRPRCKEIDKVDEVSIIWNPVCVVVMLSRGKGSQGKETADTSEVDVDESEESDFEPARKQTSSRRIIKKKVTITTYDNIIPEPDVALELGKSISLNEVVEEEAARQVHATHVRIVTESILEPARRRPSGIAFRDTSGVSKKMSSDPSQKVDTNEEEEKDDDDDDKSIDFEKSDDEETDDEFVHSKENVQDDDEETDDELVHANEQVNDDKDEEMTNAKDVDTGNGDEEITDSKKVEVEKTEVEKDDIKKAELPPTSLSLSVSLGFDPLHVVIQRVSILEKDVQELKEVDNTTTLRALLISKIPSAVNAYLRSSLGDALQKVLQKHTKELIQKYPRQVDYKEMIKEFVQANIIDKVKNQLPKFLPKAVSDFAIPIDKSRSCQTHDKHQALKDALLNSLILDDDIARGQADAEKVLRKRDRDEEDPSVRPNQGKKTKRSSTKESEPSKKSSTSKESSKGKSPAKTSKSGKFVTAEELVEELVFEMAFDDIKQTVDGVANDADQPPDDSTQTKDKASKQDWFKQPPRPPTLDPE